jgi:hypothetical protein
MDNINPPMATEKKYPVWQVVLLGVIIVLHLVYLYMVGNGFLKWTGFSVITIALLAVELIFTIYLITKKALIAYLYLVVFIIAIFMSLNVWKSIGSQTKLSEEIKNPAIAENKNKTGIDFQQITPSYLPAGYALLLQQQWPNDSIDLNYAQSPHPVAFTITEQAVNFPKGSVGINTLDNVDYNSTIWKVEHTTVNGSPAFLITKPDGELMLGFKIGQVNITIDNPDGQLGVGELNKIAASMR